MSPGPALTAIVLAGLVTGLLTSTASTDAAALAVGLASVALWAEPGVLRAGLVMGALACATVADGACVRDRTLSAPLRIWFTRAAPLGLLGDVVSVRGVLAVDGSPGETGARLVIDVDSVAAPGGLTMLPGRIHAHVSGKLVAARLSEWTAGRRVAAPVLLRDLSVARNPGSASERWQRLRQPADLAGTIKSAALIDAAPGAWWAEAAGHARRHVRATIARHIGSRSPRAAAIATAILIGDRAGLADDVQRRMRAAGTYHVIAISGGNVAILTAVVLLVLRLVIRSFRVVALFAIAVVVAYGWVVDAEPSVQRAITAAVIYLSVSLVGLRPRPFSIVAVVALVLALADPLIVLDGGAWLSFGATIGVIIAAGRFTPWATAVRVSGPAAGRPPRPSITRRCWIVIVGMFAATLMVEIILLPVSTELFSRVGLLGLVLNFIAIPAMTVVQLAGGLTVLLSGWWESGAAAAGAVAATAADGLVSSSSAADLARFLIWRVPPAPWFWVAAFYATLAAAVGLHGKTRVRKAAAVGAVASAIAIVTSPALELAGPSAGRLRLTLLDVGQGDAIVVQFPDRHTLLVDAGGGPGSNEIGDRVVTPALWELGVRTLHWFAVTHADLDHIGGARGVVEALPPREIWEGVPVPPNPDLLALRSLAHERRIVWRQMLAGHRLELGGVVLEAVHPPEPDWERPRARNDDSVVLRIGYGAVELLLAGDAGAEFEQRFPASSPRAPLRLLKVGHHGSRSSTSAKFLQTFAPQMALISAGRTNPFGHPSAEVLARLQAIDAVVFRTDLDGAVIVETDGGTVDVRTMSGRTWTMTAK